MALARLNPRQREALVASVYEEKSSEAIVKQLGLSTNAARQLLFRARSAFRKALVGEAEIQEKSISEVLSIATKKAALEARENAAQLGVFLVLIAAGFGIQPQIMVDEEVVVADSSRVGGVASSDQQPSSLAPIPPAERDDSAADTKGQPEFADSANDLADTQASRAIESEPQPAGIQIEKDDLQSNEGVGPIPIPDEVTSLSSQVLSTILPTDVDNAGVYRGSYSNEFSYVFTGVPIEVFGGTGINAFLDLDFEEGVVRSAIFQMYLEGERFYGVARYAETASSATSSGSNIQYSATEFYVADEEGNVYSDSPLANATADIVKFKKITDFSREANRGLNSE